MGISTSERKGGLYTARSSPYNTKFVHCIYVFATWVLILTSSLFHLLHLHPAQASVEEVSEEQAGSDGQAAEAQPPIPSTKKPELVPFPDDLTAMQVDCGTFHTAVLLHSGEVYTFGNGNHGQLGQGNNKVW